MAIGNKTNISKGNDIVAIGNNMTVNGNGGNEINSSLVIIGNGARASTASASVVIGKVQILHKMVR